MVKRYTLVCIQDGKRNSYGDYVKFSTPDMEESGYGEYVKLETYENETKRLKRQIECREKLIRQLQAELDHQGDMLARHAV